MQLSLLWLTRNSLPYQTIDKHQTANARIKTIVDVGIFAVCCIGVRKKTARNVTYTFRGG